MEWKVENVRNLVRLAHFSRFPIPRTGENFLIPISVSTLIKCGVGKGQRQAVDLFAFIDVIERAIIEFFRAMSAGKCIKFGFEKMLLNNLSFVY